MRGPLTILGTPALRSSFALGTFFALTLCLPPASWAAWPHDPNNGGVPLTTAALDQTVPAAASDGAGGAIVLWRDVRNGVDADVYVQRVSAAGAPLWTAGGVALCTQPGDQDGAAIVADGAGGAFVAWTDLRDGVHRQLYAQHVDAGGVPQWTAGGTPVSTPANGNRLAPSLALDGAGGVIVAWQDTRNPTSDIFAQRLNGSGAALWTTDGAAVCTVNGDQLTPMIVGDDAGGVIVTWEDRRVGVASDVYAQRLNASGVRQWVSVGIGICTVPDNQFSPVIVSAGAGATIIAWYDHRSGNHDIYAQRVNPTGTISWTAGGIVLCSATGDQTLPVIATDGVGGAIVCWNDSRNGNPDLFAQRVTAGGTPQWAANGVALCTNTGSQASPAIVADGAGGAIVGWNDDRTIATDVYAQRVTGAGTVQWTANGVPVSTAPGPQNGVCLASDLSSGAIIAFADFRNGSDYDIAAQRIERNGQLGNPEPVISSVRDVANDQGGKVKVVWVASYLDADPTYGITEYRLWRSVPASLVLAGEASLRVAATTEDPDEAALTGKRLVLPEVSSDLTWELVGSQSAAGLASYSLTAATTSDSTATGNPLTAFMVEARSGTSPGSAHWFSAPDSGYSVDDLAPAAPSPFTALYGSGTTALHWGASTEIDFSLYRLYRGTSAGFVPGPENLLAADPDTGYVDTGSSSYFYKLSAVDVHGNESGFALVSPGGNVSVSGESSLEFALGRPEPNPASRDVSVEFELPRAAFASIAVYDPTGRLVRILDRGIHPAGHARVGWDLRDASGRSVPNGVYFLRLDSAGRSLTRRVAAIH